MWMIAAAVLLTAGKALDGTPVGQAAARPVAGQNQLQYLLGTWRVTSVDPTSGERLRVCYAVKPFAGEKWLSGSGKADKPGFEASDVWGLDPASREVIRTIFDSGGTYAVVRSPGWTGDTLVLEGDARSEKGLIRVRETIRRRGRDQFTATWEARREGKWQPYALETATRVASSTCGRS